MPKKSKFLKGEDPELTSLIDCVFLLLIFFMVTTVFNVAKGISVDLPQKTDSPDQPQTKKILNVRIEDTGGAPRILLMGVEVARADLVRKMSEELAKPNVDSAMTLQADPTIKHQIVMEVVAAARGLGLSAFAFAEEEVEAEEGR